MPKNYQNQILKTLMVDLILKSYITFWPESTILLKSIWAKLIWNFFIWSSDWTVCSEAIHEKLLRNAFHSTHFEFYIFAKVTFLQSIQDFLKFYDEERNVFLWHSYPTGGSIVAIDFCFTPKQ